MYRFQKLAIQRTFSIYMHFHISIPMNKHIFLFFLNHKITEKILLFIQIFEIEGLMDLRCMRSSESKKTHF